MKSALTTIWKGTQKVLLVSLIYLIALQPIFSVMPQLAAAADPEESVELSSTLVDDPSCLDYAKMVYDPASPDYVFPDEPNGQPSSFHQIIDLTKIRATPLPFERLAAITSREYVNRVIGHFGPVGMTYYKTPTTTKEEVSPNKELLLVCNTAAQSIPDAVFNPFAPLDPTAFEVVNLLSDPTQKIAFVNPIDRYALLGEKCQGGLIAKPTSQWTDSDVVCPGFKTEDDVFQNGVWDAPKVDKRVLETLLYLVTPLEQGGAGREYIRVKKLIQYDPSNPLTQPVVAPTPDPSADPSEEADAYDQILDQQFDEAAPTSEDEEQTLYPSSYYINVNDPPHLPKTVSSSVMIDQIDKFRVTTKIEQKRLFGNNTVEYKVQPATPIDVSWQSDAGMQKDPPPDFSKLSMLESSRFLTNAAIVELLNQYGLGDLEINTSEAELSNLGDIALVVGESLLEQLLGSPRGSMSGYDLLSTLKSVGLAYLEQNLGLVPGSLTDANPLDKVDETADFSNLTLSVGRATVEYILGFPRGALRTNTGTSNELLESVGRRYLEKQIFQVTDGTLLSTDGYQLKTIGDLLERLGEGRIEQVFKLPKQSLRKPSYDNADTVKSFRQSSFKATLLFPKLEGVTQDEKMFDMADYVSGKLSLVHVPYNEVDAEGKVIASTGRNMYGFSKNDFSFPTLQINSFDENSLKKFKQIVGSRVIETSLGIYRREGATQSLLNGDSSLAPVKDVTLGGITYNARYRPLNEVGTCDGTRCAPDNGTIGDCSDDGKTCSGQGGTLGSTGWCENKSLKYASSDNWTAKRGEGDEVGTPDNLNTAANIRKNIVKLQSGWGSLNNKVGTYDHSCEEDTSFEWRDPFLGEIKAVVLNTVQVNQTVFVNQDKAPKLENFYNDGNTEGSEDSPQARYNTATLLYYNLPENHKDAPINTIPTSQSVTESQQTVDPDEVGAPPKTVAEILNTLSLGGIGGKDFTWDADGSLKQRIGMLERTLNDQVTNRTFDLANVLSQNLPASQLDGILLKKLNLLTQRPVSNKTSANILKFEEQYNNPTYNGWLFLIQDLRQRLDCKLTNGFFKLKEDRTGMECAVRPGAEEPGEDAKYEIEEAKRILDRLYKQPWALVQSIIKSLETRTFKDPSGFVNQSAMAASVAMSSVKYAVDENIRFKPETVYNVDIIRSLVAPNGKGVVPLNASVEPFFKPDTSGKSLLMRSGIEYAAKKFSSDALGQATFAAQLKTDFAEIVKVQEDVVDLFDLAEKDANEYGFDYNSLVQKGLANDDFIRIFLLDQANGVFERVGKEQALRTIWRKSGAASTIKSSEQYQSILRIARESTQQLEFYKDRIDRIKRLSGELGDEIENLGGQYNLLSGQLKTINAKTDTGIVDSAEEVKTLIKRYEPTMTAVSKNLKNANRDARDALRLSYEILHLVDEIIAGRSLPRDEKYDSAFASLNAALVEGDPSKAKNSCFEKSTLLRSLTGGGDLGQRMLDFAVETGTCRLETGLGLPTQSMFMWYKLGSAAFPPTRVETFYPEQIDEAGMPVSKVDFVLEYEVVAPPADENLFEEQPDGKLKPLVPTWNKNRWSADSLKLAIGIADQVQNDRDTIDPAQVSQWAGQQSAATIKGLISRGERVLAATALSKLAQMIPGVGKFLKQYQITDKELVAIFQGNVQPLIAKVGGSFIDSAFNLPSGSGSELIYPECTTNDGKRAPCNKDPNHPQTDPDNVRIRLVAEIGLEKLGLTMPKIPRYFSFRGSGNLAENWGNAAISERLRLAPNSFSKKMVGSSYQDTPFVDECEEHGIRCTNSSATLSRAFGFSSTPTARSLEKTRSDVLNQASKLLFNDGGSISESAQFYFQKALEEYYAAATLDRAASTEDIVTKRGYWTDLTKPEAGTNATLIANADIIPYKAAIEYLWDAFEGGAYPDEVRATIRAAIIRNLPESIGPGKAAIDELLTKDYIASLAGVDDFPLLLNTPGDAHRELYLTYIRVFQSRLNNLNGTYGLTDNLFQRFLQGTVDASEISKKVGISQTAGEILGDYLDKWIDESAPSWMRTLNEAFKLVTAEQCPALVAADNDKGIGLGTFLTQTVSGTKGCFESVGEFGIQDIIYGTSENMRQLRRLLFEEFLGGVFTADLERQIGFRPGAFMRIIDDPKHARQTLATEGVLMVADRVFGSQNTYSPCQAKAIPDADCAQAEVTSIVKQAFIAGFCEDARRNKCDFTFSSSRSLATFNKEAGNAIDRQLRRIGREYLGVEITRKDIAIHHGDMRGIALIGVQFIANQLNNALYKGDPRSPMAKFFTTYYDDIRITMGYDEPAAWVLDIYKIRGGVDQMYDYTCSAARRDTNPACADNKVTFDEYVDTIMREEKWESRTTATHLAQTRIKAAGEENARSYASKRRSQALLTIQFALLDVVAFSKDKNIPPNFSKRLLSGSGSDRANALGEYLVGSLMKDNSSLGAFLRTACGGVKTGSECYNLFKGLYTAMKNGQTSMQDFFNSKEGNNFLNLIDSGINTWFKDQFGIALPDDTFKGIYVWGMRGFKGTDFNREGFCDGSSLADVQAAGKKCTGPIGVPVGRIMQDFGEKMLTDWADSNFGFKKGTSAKIVKIAELIIDRQKLAKLAIEKGWTKAQLASAKTKNAVAIAQLASEVIVSLFEQEFTEFDRSLGLPPGTTSIIVGAAVTYGVALAMGVSGSAAIAAAFGPAFFIALGLNLILGVTKVVVTNQATGDGYYPFYSSINRIGSGPATRCIGKSASAFGGCKAEDPYNQVKVHDPATGTFDPTFTPVYRAGLKKVARAKVVGLLTDLLLMPGTSFMERAGLEPQSMRISQLFTYGGIGAEYDPTTTKVVSQLLNRNLPEDQEFPSWGYGNPEDRCSSITQSEDGLTNICERKPGWLIGFYGIPNLTGAIHIRW